MDKKARLDHLRKKRRLEELRAKSNSTPSPFKSAFKGAIEGASMGFSDELAGALEAGGSMIGVRGLGGKSLTDIRLETDEEDQEQSLSDIYTQARDAKREEYKEASDANPKSFLAGGIAGSLALPGGGIKTAIAQGAATGLGMSEENTTIEDIATGAVLGGLGGAAAKGVGKIADAGTKAFTKAGNQLDDLSGRLMYDSLSPTDSLTDDVTRYSSKEAVGKVLRDEGVGANPLRSNKGISENISSKAQKINNRITELHGQAEGSMSREDLITYLQAKADGLMEGGGSKVKVAKQVRSHIDDLTESPKTHYSADDLREYRGDIDESVNWSSDAVSQRGAREARSAVREAEFDQLGDLAGENEALFKEYSTTALAREAADKAAKRSARNRTLGLNARVSGAGGAAAIDPAHGIGIAAGSEFLKRYGKQLGSVGAKAMSKALRSSKFGPALKSAAERGESAVAATHFLLQQQHEDYRKIINEGGAE